ncbi:MAG: hypothetical protein WCK48_03820 [bacterium]
MKYFKKIAVHILIAFLILLPVILKASTSGGGNTAGGSGTQVKVTLTNPLKCNSNQGDCDTILGLITTILNNVIMPIAAVFCVLWIIYAGFKYVTAQGNPKKVEDAHQTLLWALVGTGILLGAAAISQVVQTTVQSLTNTN